jgi:hypothetical protein
VISEGAFIRANFPFGHPPEVRSRPGPSPHIAYYLGRRGSELMLAYTSSGPWRGVSPQRPIGIVEFNAAEAAKLNQRAFHIDLRCLARVLPAVAWLPGWDEPGHGVVAVADAATKDRILREAERLTRSSPEIIEIRGITSHTVVTRRPTS